MATNPIRDDVLALCGLKDCQIIVLGTAGAIVSQLTVKAQLDSQNHIIKPIWVPGTQTELALVTSDGVKIYDLAKDTDEPVFHFLLPSGKVRDSTFVIQARNPSICHQLEVQLRNSITYWNDYLLTYVVYF
jgi:E3 ubiquitin-protein ligase UBR4